MQLLLSFFFLPPTLRASATVSQFPMMMCINLKKMRSTVQSRPACMRGEMNSSSLIRFKKKKKHLTVPLKQAKLTHTCPGKKEGQFHVKHWGASRKADMKKIFKAERRHRERK